MGLHNISTCTCIAAGMIDVDMHLVYLHAEAERLDDSDDKKFIMNEIVSIRTSLRDALEKIQNMICAKKTSDDERAARGDPYDDNSDGGHTEDDSSENEDDDDESYAPRGNTSSREYQGEHKKTGESNGNQRSYVFMAASDNSFSILVALDTTLIDVLASLLCTKRETKSIDPNSYLCRYYDIRTPSEIPTSIFVGTWGNAISPYYTGILLVELGLYSEIKGSEKLKNCGKIMDFSRMSHFSHNLQRPNLHVLSAKRPTPTTHYSRQ